MEYIKATPKDVKECIELKKNVYQRLLGLSLDYWSEKYPSDELIEEDVLSSNARVIKENGEIIAFTVFYDVKEERGENDYPFKTPDLYCFSRLMVKTGYENKHVGYFLVKNIINELKDKGVKGIGIMVDPRNENALHLYSKFNFKFVETKEYIYGIYSTYELLFK